MTAIRSCRGVQHFGREVGAVGPLDRLALRIDSDLAEELVVLRQGGEELSAEPLEGRSEVELTHAAVVEREPHDAIVDDRDVGYCDDLVKE